MCLWSLHSDCGEQWEKVSPRQAISAAINSLLAEIEEEFFVGLEIIPKTINILLKSTDDEIKRNCMFILTWFSPTSKSNNISKRVYSSLNYAKLYTRSNLCLTFFFAFCLASWRWGVNLWYYVNFFFCSFPMIVEPEHNKFLVSAPLMHFLIGELNEVPAEDVRWILQLLATFGEYSK